MSDATQEEVAVTADATADAEDNTTAPVEADRPSVINDKAVRVESRFPRRNSRTSMNSVKDQYPLTVAMDLARPSPRNTNVGRQSPASAFNQQPVNGSTHEPLYHVKSSQKTSRFFILEKVQTK